MNKEEKRLIFDCSPEELFHIFQSWGEPKYRALQIWRGSYTNLWNSPGDFTTLPIYLREKIDNNFLFHTLRADTIISSKDNETQKTLFYLEDGKAIEAVLMMYEKRRTLCISTQVGCAMGCVFCATGQMGFSRNLSSGQIVEQVLYFARMLNKMGEKVTNIVLMGMGEPFLNYNETMKALETLTHPDGFNMGARRFTISTVGIIPAISKFSKEHKQYNLAISLHAVEDSLRSKLLPINKKYPVSELLLSCKEYVEKTHRRVSFEWALIKGINDSQEQAKMLADRLGIFKIGNAMLCHVNIIVLNPTKVYSGEASSIKQAKKFKNILDNYGIPCTFRVNRGSDIQAGCGQLATSNPLLNGNPTS